MKLIKREYEITMELRGKNRFQFEIITDPGSNIDSGQQMEGARQEKAQLVQRAQFDGGESLSEI